MSADVVIVGGGVAGVHTAALLSRRLSPEEANIRLVDQHGLHVFQPGLIGLAMGRLRPGNLARSLRSVLPRRVELVVDRAEQVDPVARVVVLEQGRPLRYDHLVVATGARVDRSALPGFVPAAHDFSTIPAASRLAAALEGFEGGDLVVGVSSVPYKCPPAPVEFTLLADAYLRKRGIRDKARIRYLSPIERAFPIPAAARLIEPMFGERGIELVSFANVEEVEPEKKTIRTLEGESLSFDLAVLVPPHTGSRFVSASGLADEQGWVPTDPETLRAHGFSRVHVVGDATDLPVSKTGSTAHFEAPVVVERIAADLRGREPDPELSTFDGRVVCLVETEARKATVVTYDYETPPDPPPPSLRWFMAKRAFERAYWTTIRSGMGYRLDRLVERLVR